MHYIRVNGNTYIDDIEAFEAVTKILTEVQHNIRGIR